MKKKKEMIFGIKPDMFLPHTSSKNRGDAVRIKMSSWKPAFGGWTIWWMNVPTRVRVFYRHNPPFYIKQYFCLCENSNLLLIRLYNNRKIIRKRLKNPLTHVEDN